MVSAVEIAVLCIFGLFAIAGVVFIILIPTLPQKKPWDGPSTETCNKCPMNWKQIINPNGKLYCQVPTTGVNRPPESQQGLCNGVMDLSGLTTPEEKTNWANNICNVTWMIPC